MAKFPEPPPADDLRAIGPEIHMLRGSAPLGRIFFRGRGHPVSWDEFRFWGPGQSRYDPHLSQTRPGTRLSARAGFCTRPALLRPGRWRSASRRFSRKHGSSTPRTVPLVRGFRDGARFVPARHAWALADPRRGLGCHQQRREISRETMDPAHL